MLHISVVLNNGEPTQHTFQQEKILIGSNSECELCLKGLFPQHFEVWLEEETYFIKNLADEEGPIATLDDGDFDEAILTDSAKLEIEDITITFSVEENIVAAAEGINIAEASEDFDIEDELQKLEKLFETETKEEEEEPLGEEELADLDVDALFEEVMKDVDNLPTRESASTQAVRDPIFEESSEEKGISLSFATDEEDDEELKDLLGHIEEELVSIGGGQETKQTAPPAEERITIKSHTTDDIENYEEFDDSLIFTEGTQGPDNRRRLMQVAVVLFAMLGLVTLGSYLSISKENVVDQRIASAGLTDISMAYLHAKTNRHEPQEGDWLSPTFLNEHLAAVLSAKQRSRSTLRKDGSLATDAYALSVVSGKDGSFLVSALPKGGLRQLFVPKKTYQVDSNTMELGVTDSSTALSRIRFAKKNDLTQLTPLKKTVPLSKLATLLLSSEYQLPKRLLDTKADRYIYNAPRYYRFAKDLVERLIIATEHDASEQQREFARSLYGEYRENLPELILYSRRGQEAADSMLESFTLLDAPSSPVAQITFQPDTGAIVNAEEVTHTREPQLIPDPLRPPPTISAFSGSSNKHLTLEKLPPAPDGAELLQLVDTNSDLFYMLTDLSAQHKTVRQQLNETAVTSIIDDTSFGGAQQERDLVLAEQTEELEDKIFDILSSFTETHGTSQKSLRTFAAYLKAAGFEDNVSSSVDKELALANTGAPQRSVDELLEAISRATTLREIDEAVTECATLLNQEFFPNAEELSNYESTFTRSLLDKIGDMLLSPSNSKGRGIFSSENRTTLTRILNNAGVGGRQETEFYLQEFDLLVERYRNLPPSEEEIVEKIEEHISTLPISKIASDDIEDPRTRGRLGQKLVIEAAALPPSSARDDKLSRAIGLLGEATNSNRSFWKDLLEARRLLTETPKQQILEELNSSLGFFSSDQNLYQQMHGQLTHYIFALQKLNEQSPRGGARTRFDHFRKEQEKNLLDLNHTAETLEQRGRSLIEGLETYTARLEAYLNDYKKARAAGLFASDSRHHTRTIAKLEANFEKTQSLLPKFISAANEIIVAGETYSQVATTQLAALKERRPPSRGTLRKLEESRAQTRYPNLGEADLVSELTRILESELSPFPSNR